ncbi:hypothetical protein JOM56_009784 [Amanita muscaria]
MRTFSTLFAIVALSTFSVYAAPVHLGGNVHPTVGNVRAVVGVAHTKLNGAVPRDVHDIVHNAPNVDSIPGNVNSIAARAGEGDLVKNIPTTPGNLNSIAARADDTAKNIPTTPGSLNSIVPRVDGKGTVHRVGTRPGSVKDVIPRAGDDDTLDHVPTVQAIPGNVDSVVPRDGDEPPCDGEDTQ